MTDWLTYWDRPPMDRRTPLTVRGAHVFGHITGSGPVHGRPVTLAHFLTRDLRKTASGVQVPTGVLTVGGRPVAEVTAWTDRHGIACSGRLLRPEAIAASAGLQGADPWPQWQIVSDVAHLVAVELEISQPPLIAGLAAADARERALARINTTRRDHALQRIERARR